MAEDFIGQVGQNTTNALKVLKKIETEKKFSEFAREKFNESGIRAGHSKAEDMLDELYDIAYGTTEYIDKNTGEKRIIKKSKSENRIKAIKTFAEMVGGGLNEKQTNIQNNNYGNIFLDMLSNDKK